MWNICLVVYGAFSLSPPLACSHHTSWKAGVQFSSVQFSSVAQSCLTLRPHEPQHTRPPCPSKPMSIELVMPSNYFILCHPLLLLLSIFASIRVFSNEPALRIRWPKYWSFSLSISPSNDILLISCKASGSTLSSHTIQMIMPPQSYTY